MLHISRRIVSVLAAFAVIGVAGTATAQKKPKPIKPACDITALPLIPGTEWAYQAMAPPKPLKGPVPKPRQPATVNIKVLSVEQDPDPAKKKKKEWIIKLEEKAEDKVYNTELRCKKDALLVPPESFFFSGEPGGGIQIVLGELTRPETSAWSYLFQLGKMVIPQWTEEIAVPFTRTAFQDTGTLVTNGNLDMQRNIMIGIPEKLEIEMGPFEVTPLQVDLRGSVFLDMEGGKQEFSIPANTLSRLWFADGIGVVQVANTNLHWYQLVEHIDPNKPPEEAPAAGTAGAAAPAKK